jgi:hypothetical protein
MTSRMSCRCGYDFRTETDGELAAVLQWHLANEHPTQPVDDWLYEKPFPEDVGGRPGVQKSPP